MAETPSQTRGANVTEFSVSEISGAIKRALEDGFGHVRLRGEVSGYRGPHASGHCYFSLKDEKAKIDAVIWKGIFNRLRLKPEEGMEVIATGKISSFPGSSKYQIIVETLEPAGLGALMAQLEERKRKFAAEGLFNEDRKQLLPFLPRVVGIVTSPTGAVIRDMLHGFQERFPTHVVVWPVRVQGEGSAAEIAAAIRGFNALPTQSVIPQPDVLIVARGGGSLEDLWGFNEEVVVRAVADSQIPVISAVGHETDWTLIDLVADARAPTPTKAAEWAVPKHSELVEETGKLGLRLSVAIRRAIETHQQKLKATSRGLPRPDELTALARQRFDGVTNRLGSALKARVHRSRSRFLEVAGRWPLPATLFTAARHRNDAITRRLPYALSGNTQAHKTRLVQQSARLQARPLLARINRGQEHSVSLATRMDRAFKTAQRQRKTQLEQYTKLLNSLSYQSVLQRGYALVRDASGAMVRDVSAITYGAKLELQLRDGRINVTANEDVPPTKTTKGSHEGSSKPTNVPTTRRKRREKDQGNLF